MSFRTMGTPKLSELTVRGYTADRTLMERVQKASTRGQRVQVTLNAVVSEVHFHGEGAGFELSSDGPFNIEVLA